MARNEGPAVKLLLVAGVLVLLQLLFLAAPSPAQAVATTCSIKVGGQDVSGHSTSDHPIVVSANGTTPVELDTNDEIANASITAKFGPVSVPQSLPDATGQMHWQGDAPGQPVRDVRCGPVRSRGDD